MKKINEFGGPGYDRSGFGARLDYSGVRGGKSLTRNQLKRSSDYPYDKGNKMSVGFGGMNDMSTQSHNPITPKNTEHSVWDDLEEVAGSPILLSKQPGVGSATGVPGAGGALSWSKNPIKSWDEKEEQNEGGFMAGASGFADTANSCPELTPVDDVTVKKKEIDMSKQYSDRPKKDILVIATDRPFSSGLGNSNRLSRGLYGLMAKESAWDWLYKKFLKK